MFKYVYFRLKKLASSPTFGKFYQFYNIVIYLLGLFKKITKFLDVKMALPNKHYIKINALFRNADDIHQKNEEHLGEKISGEKRSRGQKRESTISKVFENFQGFVESVENIVGCTPNRGKLNMKTLKRREILELRCTISLEQNP
jgi:hypothetical protein